MAPTIESFLPSIWSPSLISVGCPSRDEMEVRVSDAPFDVSLGLRRLDFRLARRVLLLSGGGEGGRLGGTADSLVGGFDGGSDKLLALSDDRVDLKSVVALRRLCAEWRATIGRWKP